MERVSPEKQILHKQWVKKNSSKNSSKQSHVTWYHARPFDTALSHIATPLDVMLHHSTLQCVVWTLRASPFSFWLDHLVFFYTIWQMRARLFAFWLDYLIWCPALTCVASPFMFCLNCFRLSSPIPAKKAKQFVLCLCQLLSVCAIS